MWREGVCVYAGPVQSLLTPSSLWPLCIAVASRDPAAHSIIFPLLTICASEDFPHYMRTAWCLKLLYAL